MSDNLHTSAPTCTPLSGHQIIRLEGPDAVAFSQAQFASNAAALAAGNWQWSCWLNAKGRVIAIFMLCRISEQQLLMVLADGGAESVAEQLGRFIFRRKLRIEVDSELVVSGAFTTTAATGAAISCEQEGFVFDLGVNALPRCLRLSRGDSTAADPTFELQWRQADLRLGLPRLEASQQEQWTPQQIGLDRLHAYSVNKGCYPGQEIVARTHFLGKAKRATCLLQVAAGSHCADSVHDGDDQAIGSLLSVAGELALAVLPVDANTEALRVSQTAAVTLPLLDGLAR